MNRGTNTGADIRYEKSDINRIGDPVGRSAGARAPIAGDAMKRMPLECAEARSTRFFGWRHRVLRKASMIGHCRFVPELHAAISAESVRATR